MYKLIDVTTVEIPKYEDCSWIGDQATILFQNILKFLGGETPYGIKCTELQNKLLELLPEFRYNPPIKAQYISGTVWNNGLIGDMYIYIEYTKSETPYNPEQVSAQSEDAIHLMEEVVANQSKCHVAAYSKADANRLLIEVSTGVRYAF